MSNVSARISLVFPRFNFHFILVQSTKAIGTGRVGLRHSPPQKGGQQSFALQNNTALNHYQSAPPSADTHQHNYHQQYQYQNQFYDLDGAGASVLAPISPPPRPFFDGRPNLQDRLQRHRQPNNNNTAVTPAATTNNGSQDSSAPIAVGY